MELELEPLHVTTGAVLMKSEPFVQLPLAADFAYLAADPMAVAMTLTAEVETPGGEIASDAQTWGFGRDLLEQAFSVPDVTHGTGDVRTHLLSGTGVLRITLIDALRQHSEVYVQAMALAEFVRQMYLLVPAGAEQVDVDAMLRALEGEAQ